MSALSERPITAPSLPPVRDASPAEAFWMLDPRGRRYLGITGEEFLRRWQAGYYAADLDQPGVVDVAMLVPFVRAGACLGALAAGRGARGAGAGNWMESVARTGG